MFYFFFRCFGTYSEKGMRYGKKFVGRVLMIILKGLVVIKKFAGNCSEKIEL